MGENEIMEEREIIERIKSICAVRSWTLYRLSKESGIAYSTLCTMLHKVNVPSIPTLIRICDAFNITLAEFFDPDFDRTKLTPRERVVLRKWDYLTEENQMALEKYMSYLLSEQQNEQQNE